MLNLPKSTAHRLCTVMERQGYLQKMMDGKRYMPGEKLRKLAIGVLAHSELRAQQHAILKSLSRDIGETCNLSYPDGSEMMYADRVETQWPLRLQLTIGTHVPLYCTASGKMYLSSLPRKKREKVAGQLELVSHTPNTITNLSDLLVDLEQINKHAVSVDREEYVEGMIAIAVPIADEGRRLYATVSFHAPVARMKLDAAMEHVPRLCKAARELASLVEEGGS